MATTITVRPTSAVTIDPQQSFDLCRRWQEWFDAQLSPLGMRAPPAVLGQDADTYRRETYRTLKHTYLPPSHELYKPQYRGMPSDALDTLGPQLVQACVAEYQNPAHLQDGELRPIKKTGPDGQTWIDWIGREHFTKQMTRPGRRVVSFTTDRGRYDAVKARWF